VGLNSIAALTQGNISTFHKTNWRPDQDHQQRDPPLEGPQHAFADSSRDLPVALGASLREQALRLQEKYQIDCGSRRSLDRLVQNVH
jgi:hypothetical protein